jgi:hypothetical protein
MTPVRSRALGIGQFRGHFPCKSPPTHHPQMTGTKCPKSRLPTFDPTAELLRMLLTMMNASLTHSLLSLVPLFPVVILLDCFLLLFFPLEDCGVGSLVVVPVGEGCLPA